MYQSRLQTHGQAGVVLGGRCCAWRSRIWQADEGHHNEVVGILWQGHTQPFPVTFDAMRDTVFTTFFHAALTDEEPHHTYCPEGPDSWCFYQKGLAKGEELGSHRKKVGTPLSHEVVSHVKDVYMRMSQK